MKRETLTPEAVEAVASDTVRRLAQLPQVARSFEDPDIDEAQIKAFCDLLMKPDPDADLRFIEDRLTVLLALEVLKPIWRLAVQRNKMAALALASGKRAVH